MLNFLDQKEEEIFARDGYVVRKVLDQPQIDAALREIEEWTNVYFGTQISGLPAQSTPGLFFSELESSNNRRENLTERLDALVGASLIRGTSGASPYQTGVVIKHAHEIGLNLHQHPPMLLDLFTRYVLCWCSLVDVDAESGALMVVPRSHSLYRHIHVPGEAFFFNSYQDELIHRYAIPVPLKAGEAVYFDNLILHGSYPNLRPTSRPAILTSFLGDGVERVSCRRAADGSIEFVADPREGYSLYEKGDDFERASDDLVVKRLPFWSRKATLMELEVLLQSDLHPSEDFDPLEFLCGPEKQDEYQTQADAPASPNRNLLVRITASLLPGVIKRSLRVIVNGLGGRRVATSVLSQCDFAQYPLRTAMPQPFADAQCNELLYRDGYVTMPFLDAADVDRLAKAVMETETAHDQSDVHILTHFRLSAFSNDAAYKERLFDAAWECLKDKVEAILPGFEPLVINLFDKQPSSGYDPVPIHQNPSFVEEPEHKSVSLWIPFSDVDKDNGTVGVLPRSHNRFNRMRAGNMAHEDVFAEVQSDLENTLFVPIVLKKGEMLALDDSIIHWSYPNISDRERNAIQLIMVPKDVPHIYYFYDDTAGGHPMMDRYEVDKNFFFGFNCKARPETLKHIDRLPYRYRPITRAELLEDSAQL